MPLVTISPTTNLRPLGHAGNYGNPRGEEALTRTQGIDISLIICSSASLRLWRVQFSQDDFVTVVRTLPTLLHALGGDPPESGLSACRQADRYMIQKPHEPTPPPATRDTSAGTPVRPAIVTRSHSSWYSTVSEGGLRLSPGTSPLLTAPPGASHRAASLAVLELVGACLVTNCQMGKNTTAEYLLNPKFFTSCS